MDKFRIAVKSFIINSENKLLLIKRRSNDVHKPGQWDIPGGRLELGENPFLGLKRETKEETNLDIDIVSPLHVQHFTRDDGQKITMLIFFCRPKNIDLRLSEEHTEHSWVNLDQKEKIPSWLSEPCMNFEKYYFKN